jgi:hypothetical protein
MHRLFLRRLPVFVLLFTLALALHHSRAAAQAPAAERTRPVVAVLDFESNTLTHDQEAAFSQALWSEFFRSPITRVLPRDDVRQYLIRYDLHPGEPYAPTVPLARVAQALRVDYLIVGHANVLGESSAVDYAIYSSKLGETVAKENFVQRGKIEDLLLTVPTYAAAMISVVKKVESGANISARQLEQAPPPAPGSTLDVGDADANAPSKVSGRLTKVRENRRSHRSSPRSRSYR